MKSLKSPDFAFIVLVVISYLFVISYNPNSYENDDTIFNVKAAQKHLTFLASEPHPIGTKAHREVEKYIFDQGNALGFEMEVAEHSLVSTYECNKYISKVRNIHALKKGTDSDGIIVFAAHYDSQPNTPGAADDAQAVAAFLTNMASLTATETKNDILFLITDGEETGLNGAKAFLEYFDKKDEIKYVFNFEARGNSGPVFAFETSDNNKQVIAEFRSLKNARRYTSSLMYEVYKLMPNDTDFTIFKKMGIQGISMANIDGFVNYHSMTDSPANIDPSSLFHHGLMVHDLIEKYKNMELVESSNSNSTYFNLLGPYLVIQYAPFWNIILWIVTVLLLVLFARKSIDKFSLVQYFKHFLFLVILLAVSIAIGFLLRFLILQLYPHYNNFYSHNFYNATHYFIPFIGISALVLLVYCRSAFQQKKDNYKYTHLAGLTLFTLLGIVSYFLIETASYFFIIPLFSYLAIQLFNRKKDSNPWIESLAMVIPIASFLPFSYMFFVVFSFSLPYAAMLCFSFCLIMMIPLLAKVQRLIPMLVGMLIVLGLIRAHNVSSITGARPYQAQFHYADDINIVNGEEQVSNVKLVDNNKREDYLEKQVLKEYNSIIPASENIFNVEIDSLTEESGKEMKRFKIMATSSNDIIRIDTKCPDMDKWQNIRLNAEAIEDVCYIRYLGDISNAPFSLEFSVEADLEIEANFVTFQRGLIDKMNLGPTVIPGVGFYGGTILHNYRFTW